MYEDNLKRNLITNGPRDAARLLQDITPEAPQLLMQMRT